jgi:two-component system OmpR family response regulator
MRKVLVIDDDPAIARLVGAALEKRKLDHDLEYCGDGGQGRLKAAAGGYDLIVLDLAMPFMDGVAALAEMRRNPKSRAVPVVVVTALTDPALHQQVRDLGAVAVITKPFEHWELADAVRLVLAGDELQPPAGPPEPLDS